MMLSFASSEEKGERQVANKITVNRPDGTSFVGVSDASIQQEGTGGNATVVMPGAGWVLVDGIAPRVKSSRVAASASGSQILLQNFPFSGVGMPTRSRVLLVQATNGGTVAALDASVERTLTAGQYVDIVNSDPVQIGMPQQYVASTLPETATALSAAQDALEAEDPES